MKYRRDIFYIAGDEYYKKVTRKLRPCSIILKTLRGFESLVYKAINAAGTYSPPYIETVHFVKGCVSRAKTIIREIIILSRIARFALDDYIISLSHAR